MDFQAGQMLQHYRLVEKIGEGGMGVVWKAVDTTLEREVAIKGLPAAFATDAERLARFERDGVPLLGSPHPVMQVPQAVVGRSLGRFDIDPSGRLLAADSEEQIDPDRISLILDWRAD